MQYQTNYRPQELKCAKELPDDDMMTPAGSGLHKTLTKRVTQQHGTEDQSIDWWQGTAEVLDS